MKIPLTYVGGIFLFQRKFSGISSETKALNVF